MSAAVNCHPNCGNARPSTKVEITHVTALSTGPPSRG